MAGGQVPMTAGPQIVPAAQVAGYESAPVAGGGFQYAEVVRGTNRGTASPAERTTHRAAAHNRAGA